MGPIGVFDSGMGGLTVLRALHQRLPAEDLLYFGDTARVPYGTKGERTVRAFAAQNASFLMSRGVKMIVVACNTASAFAIASLREQLPVPVLGVIEPGVSAALAQTRGGSIGVVATRGTINSKRYQELLAESIPKTKVLARPCPLFVPLVEEGMIDHDITRQVVAGDLEVLRGAGVDTLILGCTHYPLLKDVIGRFMGPDVALVDSAETLADAAADLLREQGLARKESSTEGRMDFWLSDIPWKFQEVGSRFLGRPIDEVNTVNVNEANWDGHWDQSAVREDNT